MVVVVLFLLNACTSYYNETIDPVLNRAILPRLHSLNVNTVISDSGVTRYRIRAPQWDVFDRTSQPYWEFPYGVHFERFDESLKVDANIHSEYAKFLEHEQIWHLKGNVRATNIRGEMFETPELFWDQRLERIYSDSLIEITQENYIIIGIGFESNQEMTKYQVRNTQAIIPIDEEIE